MVSPFKPNVFVSYARKDVQWFQHLAKAMKPWSSKAAFDSWDDTQLEPGMRWVDTVKEKLKTSHIMIMLVSMEFLASDFIASTELKSAFLRAKTDGVLILWIPVGTCMLEETPFTEFQALWPPSSPLSSVNQTNLDHVLTEIARKIKRAIIDYKPPQKTDKLPASFMKWLALRRLPFVMRNATSLTVQLDRQYCMDIFLSRKMVVFEMVLSDSRQCMNLAPEFLRINNEMDLAHIGLRQDAFVVSARQFPKIMSELVFWHTIEQVYTCTKLADSLVKERSERPGHPQSQKGQDSHKVRERSGHPPFVSPNLGLPRFGRHSG